MCFCIAFGSILAPFRINLHASPHPFPDLFVPVPQRVPFLRSLFLLLGPLWSPFSTHLGPISIHLGSLWLPLAPFYHPFASHRVPGGIECYLELLMLFGFVNAFPILVNAFPKLLTLTQMGIVNAVWIINAFPILVNVRTYAKFSLLDPSLMVCRQLTNYSSHAVHHLSIYINGDTQQYTETVLDITMHSFQTGL
jgi:hypothetical protein